MTGLLPTWLQQPLPIAGPGQSLELHSSLPFGLEGPKCLDHPLLPLLGRYSMELDQKWDSWCTDVCPFRMPTPRQRISLPPHSTGLSSVSIILCFFFLNIFS